jgi:hypothetical protein
MQQAASDSGGVRQAATVTRLAWGVLAGALHDWRRATLARFRCDVKQSRRGCDRLCPAAQGSTVSRRARWQGLLCVGTPAARV